MLTVLLVLTLVALGLVVASAVKRAPLWMAVLILVLIELLRALPLGR